jgi:hypothetical protein
MWFIPLGHTEFTHFVTFYQMVHIENSFAQCFLVSDVVEKQYLLIRTVFVTNQIRRSICGHSRLCHGGLYCSESCLHAYRFHWLVCPS